MMMLESPQLKSMGDALIDKLPSKTYAQHVGRVVKVAGLLIESCGPDVSSGDQVLRLLARFHRMSSPGMAMRRPGSARRVDE